MSWGCLVKNVYINRTAKRLVSHELVEIEESIATARADIMFWCGRGNQPEPFLDKLSELQDLAVREYQLNLINDAPEEEVEDD